MKKERVRFDNNICLNYSVIYNYALKSEWGNVTLPVHYEPSLWGVVMYQGEDICGFWIGHLRGNNKLTNFITKCVYFDSLPVWVNKEARIYEAELLRKVRDFAKIDRIVMLNITHWGRGSIKTDIQEKSGTFLIDLSKTEEDLWKMVDSKQRNIIRKGERSCVEVVALSGETALSYLTDFQMLRAQTQSRAIKRNSKSSMLLKNDNFFRDLFLKQGTTLFVGKVYDKIATVALMIESGQTVYYYSGGSDYKLNRETGSSAYLIWKTIQHYRNKEGINYFDLGGVPVFEDINNPDKNHPAYGVFQFKRSFGGQYYESAIGKVVIHSVKYKILSFILRQRELLRVFSKLGM